MNDIHETGRILITGASRGIGLATARQLVCRGANLVLVARDEDKLLRIAADAEQHGARIQVVRMDLTNEASVSRGIERVLKHGPVHVLVNNAGVCHQGRFMQLSETQRAEEWLLNYHGAVRMIRELLPSMLQRRQGRIINVSSLLGSSAAPTTANYSATKAALEAFSQGLRGEIADSGISVEVFMAPHTQTEMGRRVVMDGVISLPVDYVAARLVRAIERPQHRSYGSPVYRLFAVLSRWFPRTMEHQMRRAARSALRDPKHPELSSYQRKADG